MWSTLATAQFGLLTRAQAYELGLKRPHIERLLERGTWEIVYPAVFRIAGSSKAWPHALMAAWLWAKQNTAVSHASAARLHGFDKYREDDSVHLLSRFVQKPPEGITLHRTRKLVETEICDLQGMKVTTIARTLFDLFRDDAKQGARTIDEALRRGMVRTNELEHVAGLNRRRGKAGVGDFDRLVEDRATYGRMDSDLETDVATFLKERGFPPHRRQFHITVPGRLTAQVDFAWPELRACIQAHSSTIHRQGKVWDKDQSTENDLRGAGWEVVIATRSMLDKEPDALAANIRTALSVKNKKPGYEIEGLGDVRGKA